MKLLTRWIAWQCVKAYAAFAMGLGAFFLVIDAFVNLGRLSEGDALTNIVQRYARMLPEMFHLLSPFLTLLSALWVIAAMMRSGELIPLRAAGYSNRQIALPLLGIGLAFAPLSWLDREVVLPRLADLRRAHSLRRDVLYPRPVADPKGGVLSARHYALKESRLERARYVLLDAQRREALTIVAASASHETGGWRFREGFVIRSGPDGDEVLPIGDEGHLLPSPVRPSDVEASIGSPMYLSAEQLREQIERTPGFRHLAVQLYERFTQPLAGLVLLLIAVPLSLGGEEGRAFVRFLASLLVSVGYFLLSTLCMELGAREALQPALAASLPLLLCGSLGAVLVWRAR